MMITVSRADIEDIHIQVEAAIKSIRKGYTGTAVAELNGALLLIDGLLKTLTPAPTRL